MPAFGSVIRADFRLAPEALPFAAALADGAVERLEFETVLPIRGVRLPFVRVTARSLDAGLESMRADPAVASLEAMERRDRRGLAAVRWREGALEWLRSGVDRYPGLALRSALGTTDGWRIGVRGRTEDALLGFRRHARDAGHAVEISRFATGDRDESGGVTAAQREALTIAVERGYFERPREVTLADLAAELDISRQAFGGRLRRGQRNLIRHGLLGDG